MGAIIKQASFVIEGLYLSGETSARDKIMLRNLQVSAVVNVTKELPFFHEGIYFIQPLIKYKCSNKNNFLSTFIDDKERKITYFRVPITDHDAASIMINFIEVIANR